MVKGDPVQKISSALLQPRHYGPGTEGTTFAKKAESLPRALIAAVGGRLDAWPTVASFDQQVGRSLHP